MPVGALLLVGHDPQNGDLGYVGSVSSGLGARVSRVLADAFHGFRATSPPWSDLPRTAVESSVVWLRPGCVAAVEYRDFAARGRFRHLAFKGLDYSADTTPEWLPLPRGLG